MSTDLTRLEGFGDELLEACREQLDTLPYTRHGPATASGKTKRALRREALETPEGYQLNLYGPGSLLTLIYGRRPGAFPNLRDIKQWIADKNIVPRPDSKGRPVSTDTLAYLIGRKIQREGNEVWQQGPPSQLFASILSAENVNAAVKSFIVPLLVEDVRTALRETIRS